MTIDPVPAALDGPYVIGLEEEDGGAVNIAMTVAACGASVPAAQDAAVPNNCVPDGAAGPADGYYTFTGSLIDQAGNAATTFTRMILQDLTAPLITANVAPSPVLTGGSPATFGSAVSDNVDLKGTNFTFDFAGGADWMPFSADAVAGDGTPFDGAHTTTASSSTTIDFVRGLEQVTGADLPAGGIATVTNVRAIAEDMAENVSGAVSNNINPGTITELPVGFGAAGILAPGWLLTDPAANADLCDGTGGDDDTCGDGAPGVSPVGAEPSLTLTAEVSGASGTFANPFLSGHVFFYMVDLAGNNVLLADVPANSAALNDSGAARTYTWTYELTSADVAGLNGNTIQTFAIGVNSDGDGLQLADLAIDVVVGT